MKIEREVTDIIVAVLTAYLSYIFVMSPESADFIDYGVWTGVMIIILVFLHMILRQLGYFTQKESIIVSYICIILIILLFTFYLVGDVQYYRGYWDDLSFLPGELVFIVINYSLFFIIGFAAYIGRYSD